MDPVVGPSCGVNREHQRSGKHARGRGRDVDPPLSSLLTILGIVIGITTVVTVASLHHRFAPGSGDLLQQLGPDNIFLFKSSGDPNMDPPLKERKRRAMKPEYAITSSAGCQFREDVGLVLYIPARGGRQPHHRARAATSPTPSTSPACLPT